MNIICQLKLKQPKYTYYLITKQLRTSLLILMLRQSTNSSVCDLQREPRLCTLMSAERDTGDTAPVQSLGEFGCLWRWAQKSSSLFSGRSGWGQTQHFLNVLSDGHGAEDVEEDEGAVGVVLAQQVAVGKALDVGQWHKGEFGHDSSIKDGVEHAHQSCKTEANSKHGLHAHHRQVSVVILKLLFLPFNLLLLLASC